MFTELARNPKVDEDDEWDLEKYELVGLGNCFAH